MQWGPLLNFALFIFPSPPIFCICIHELYCCCTQSSVEFYSDRVIVKQISFPINSGIVGEVLTKYYCIVSLGLGSSVDLYFFSSFSVCYFSFVCLFYFIPSLPYPPIFEPYAVGYVNKVLIFIAIEKVKMKYGWAVGLFIQLFFLFTFYTVSYTKAAQMQNPCKRN